MRGTKLRIDIGDQAQRDLKDAWLWACDEWSEKDADTYYRAIEHAFDVLPLSPWMGDLRHDVHDGLLIFRFGSHRIHYTIRNNAVRLLRVVLIDPDEDAG